MGLAREHLEYFKDLFEGRAALSWNAWFKLNQPILEQTLPRADYLHLKFNKLEEAERILKGEGIAFVITPAGKREKLYSQYAPEACDEFGRPKESFLRKAYGGAIGAFLDNKTEEARTIIEQYLRKQNRRSVSAREEIFADLCVDGEIQMACGNPELGRILLEPLAALEIGDDCIDPIIFRARELLQLPRMQD